VDAADAADPLDAGRVGPWLAQLGAALRGEADADVPCDGCTACCRASQFVPIGPDELLFPVPGRSGHVLLGYDDHGHCPMLVEDGCSVYAHRPRACRTYDCRAYAAAGVEPDPDTQADVARRVRRWRFAVEEDEDEVGLAAVRAAAAWVREHRAALPVAVAPSTPSHHAALAVELHAAFLPGPDRPAPSELVARLTP
jgi:Fe-S-cluster containining protein